LSDGQQFHQYQPKSHLTSTHWVIVNNSTVNISGIVDHHWMSWSERWFLLILVELLTITQWVEERSTIPPISTKITSHLNSLSDGQQFHQYQPKSHLDHHSMNWSERWFLLILVELLTIIQWVEVRGDCFWYWWNCWPISSHLNSFSDGQQFHQYQQKSPLT
jgi:hypothetical protein